MWDRIRAFLVQVGEEEVAHSRVQLPDTRGHHGDGEGCFVVSRHLLHSLFLTGEKCTNNNVGLSSYKSDLKCEGLVW